MNHRFDDDDNTSLYIDDPIDIDAILILLGLNSPDELDSEKAKKMAELYGVDIEECKNPTTGLVEKMIKRLKEKNNIDIEDENERAVRK